MMARAALNMGLGQSTRPAPSHRTQPTKIDMHKPITALTFAAVFMAGVFVGCIAVGGTVLGWW